MESEITLTKAMITKFSQEETVNCFNPECGKLLYEGDTVRRLASHGGKYFCPDGCLITEIRDKPLTDEELIALLLKGEQRQPVKRRGHTKPRFTILDEERRNEEKPLKLANIYNYY